MAARDLTKAGLWWTLCDYNHIFFALKLVAVLRIPSVEDLKMRLIG